MELSRSLLIILVTSVLTENFILSKFLGICPFLGVSKKVSGSVGMGISVIVVMILATMITFPIYHLVLVNLNIQYMDTITFIIIIALFVQIIEILLKKLIPPLYRALGVYLPLMATNCAILGVTLLNISNEYSFLEAVFNSFCAGVGFMIVLLIFTGVRGRIETRNVPRALRGTPITLIAASIVSLSFIGFGGLVEGLFNV